MEAELFNTGVKIINVLKKAGYEAYFVGGAVRDHLLHREINDIDIATSATVTEIKKLFHHTIPVGEKHGTVIVRMDKSSFEISTFKSKIKDRATIYTDLALRDITINALALTEQFTVFDPYHFIEDVHRKLIRAVGNPLERFREDPLRMLRCIRFVSQLGFHLDERTKHVIMGNCSLLKNVAIERIVTEIEKVLMGRYPNKAFHFLYQTGLYKEIPFLTEDEPSLLKIINIPFSVLFSIEEKWAVLFYFEKDKFMLPIAKSSKKEINTIVKGFKKVQEDGWDDYFLYQTGLTVAKKIARFEEAIAGSSTKTVEELEMVYGLLPIKSQQDIAVTGFELMNAIQKKPGSWIREVFTLIEKAIISNEIVNKKKELLLWAKSYVSEIEKNGGGDV